MTHAHTDLDRNLVYLRTYRAPTAFTSLAIAAVVFLVQWEERRRSRAALRDLEPYLLKDIGLTQEDVDRELGRR